MDQHIGQTHSDLPLLIEVERPEPNASHPAGTKLSGFGWVLCADQVGSIAVSMDGVLQCYATLGIPRSDLESSYSSYPNAEHAGFWFSFDVPAGKPPGPAKLSLQINAGGHKHERDVPVVIELPGGPALSSATFDTIKLEVEEAIFDGGTSLRVSGWAVCTDPIREVELFLRDKSIGYATRGLPRGDVATAMPRYRNAAASGFFIEANVDPIEVFGAEAVVVVTDDAGVSRSAKRPIEQVNNLRLFCDEVFLSRDGAVSGIGWAVCATGIEAIRIEVDGETIGHADTGISRPDVGKCYPKFPNARNAGFRINCRSDKVWNGLHLVRITAIGGGGEQQSIEHAVEAGFGAREEDAPAEVVGGTSGQLKFYLDVPAIRAGHAIDPARGFMPLSGWALAPSGIDRIEVFVDGAYHGNAFTGIRREDIQSAFPDIDALLSGFSMLIPPQVMRKGTHDLRMVFHDKDGNTGEISFSVDAEPAPEGPGPWQLREKIKHAEVDLAYRVLRAADYRPLWTLLLPMRAAGAQDLALLRSTIGSLANQAYSVWRMVVCLPGSPQPEASGPEDVRAIALAGFDHLAPRISFLVVEPNKFLSDFMSEGGMLALVSPGDRLGEDALLEMTQAACRKPKAEFFYSDERRVDPSDGEEKAFFKPDWSPDLLLSTNYIGRLWAARTGLVRRSKLTFGSLAGNGEYDAVLRLTEIANAVDHVTKVLCARHGSGPDSEACEQAALRRAAERRCVEATIEPGCVPGTFRTKYSVARHLEKHALVSIIIPSIASRGLVRVTVESIRQKTLWPNFEIIILDNIRPTADAGLLGWKNWMREAADSVVEIDEPFNWSRFNNIGAARANGEFLLFLNDDVEVLDGSWLHGLIEHAQRGEIGVVGPQLLYPDGRVQHAGMFLSGKVGRHAFRFYPGDAPGPFGLARTQRNVISVTGACLLTQRRVFNAVGGFDEAHPIINNDLDYALRLQRAGYRVVYTPHVSLIHHEMVSRSKLQDVYNSDHFDAAWKNLFLKGDPYFHPRLSGHFDDYQSDPEPLQQFQAGHPLVARENVRRILVVKLDHIGDFIAAFPAFRRLKQHFPHAELHVLAATASLSLAALEPAIDKVIEFNFFHAKSSEGALDVGEDALLDLRQRLAPMRYDIAIDLRRQSETRTILKHTGARWLAGFDQGYRHKFLDITVEFEGDKERNFKRSHVTESMMQLVEAVVTACSTERQLIQHSLPSGELAYAAFRALPAVNLIADRLLARPIVCVHSGAGSANKQWPAAHFAGLIDLLVTEEFTNVVIIGGPDEAEFTELVLAEVRHTEYVFPLVGKTSLRDLPAVLLACELYVGNDSGPKHMAAGLGIPTIGIHSGSVDAGEWGPIGPLTVTLRRDMTCGPCYIANASDCPRSLACLTGIAVGDVFRACQKMLPTRRKRERPAEAPPELHLYRKSRRSGSRIQLC